MDTSYCLRECWVGTPLGEKEPLVHDRNCVNWKCPTCSSFRAKMDREKIARIVCGHIFDEWETLPEDVREGYLSNADKLIRYFQEG